MIITDSLEVTFFIMLGCALDINYKYSSPLRFYIYIVHSRIGILLREVLFSTYVLIAGNYFLVRGSPSTLTQLRIK